MKRLIPAGTFLVGLLVGYVGRNFLQVQFKYDFDIVDISSIIVTVLIAFLLQNYITARHTKSRSEKDLLINEAKESLRISRETRKVIHASHEKSTLTTDDFFAITAALKTLGISLVALKDFVDVFSEDRCAASFNVVMNNFGKYRRLTSKPVGQTYTQPEFSEENKTFREFEKSLITLMREINTP